MKNNKLSSLSLFIFSFISDFKKLWVKTHRKTILTLIMNIYRNTIQQK